VIKLRRLRWITHVSWEESNTYNILTGRPYGRNKFEKWGIIKEDNIKIGFKDMNLIELTQDRFL
jgi:hypothetical protein